MTSATQPKSNAPHCDAVYAAHIARVTVETLAGRPLSHANTPFVDACLSNLATLAGRLVQASHALANPYDDEAVRLASLLRSVASRPGEQAIQACGHYIREDFSLYARLMRTESSRAAVPADPLHDAQPVSVVVMIGPGLGIGDEIKLRGLLKRIERHFAMRAHDVHIFSYCPSIWRTLESGWQVDDLGLQPMAAFDRLTTLRATTSAGEVLVVFCNFLRRDALRVMLPYEDWHDVLDISVGSGEVVLRRHGERAELHWCGLNAEYPCLSRALGRIGEHILPRRAPAEPFTAMRPGPATTRGPVFRILLSPFTSKRSPLTAYDWADYIATLARALPRGRRVLCVVLPGLTPECNAHAADIARLASHQLRGRGHAELAHTGDNALTTQNAIAHVVHELTRADLLFGIDTYTAHLAAETGTPSIALCLEHNPRFWAPSPWTFWFNLQTGRHCVLQAARAVIRLLDTGKQCGLPFNGMVHATSLLAYAGGVRAAKAYELLDRIWHALPGGVQQALERLDDQFSWPRWRDRFHDRAPDELDVVSRSNFVRLLRLTEPSLWKSDDRIAG